MGAVGMMDKLLLYGLLKNKSGAEISASGNPAIMSDSLKNNPMNEMKVFGWSKQETTTGAQLWDEDNAISGHILADGTVQNANKTNNEVIGDYQKVSGNNITLSYSVTVPETITSQSLWFAISCYDSEKNFLKRKDFQRNSATGLQKGNTTIELVENTEYIRISWRKYADGVLMASEGTEALPYEPYTGGQPSPSPDYPQQIVSAGSDGKIGVEVRGKNLFGLTGIRDNEYLRIEKIENNTIYARPTNMNAESPGTTNYSNGWVDFSEKIKVISGILYTISLSYKAVQKMMEIEKLDSARILVFKDSENIILNEEIKQEIGKYVDVEFPLLIPDGTDSIYFTITCNNCSVAIKNIQIEEGGYTSYEPYYEPQSLSISTPTGLPAIPVNTDGNYTDANGQQWISDYVDLKRGKLYKKVTRLNLKDVDAISVAHGFHSNGNGYLSIGVKNMNKKYQPISNRYKGSEWTQKSGYTYIPNSNTIVFVDDRFTDKQTAIKLVQNTYAIYALTSQIETDLTPEEIQAYKNLVTYAGTTIVENDAECYMEVSAGGGDGLRAKKLALILGE